MKPFVPYFTDDEKAKLARIADMLGTTFPADYTAFEALRNELKARAEIVLKEETDLRSVDYMITAIQIFQAIHKKVLKQKEAFEDALATKKDTLQDLINELTEN